MNQFDITQLLGPNGPKGKMTKLTKRTPKPKPTGGASPHLGIVFNTRELATVLAALRRFQELDPTDVEGMDQFYDEKPLTAEMIDKLCERINR